mmetsp:Transcript_21673/g.45761  ORF Transcript_21673/g.45761 Transcript_21673/m.45761 type:complete len:259 (+) Transcript_21673:366-1142(+)
MYFDGRRLQAAHSRRAPAVMVHLVAFIVLFRLCRAIDGLHLGRAIHEDDVIALVLLGGLVEELLVQEVPGGTGKGGSTGGGTGHLAKGGTVLGEFVPASAVAPNDGMFVLDGSLDFPVSFRIGKANGVFGVFVVLSEFGGVGSDGFFSGWKPVDDEVSLLVVIDLENGDLLSVVADLPFSAPSFGALLGLLLVVDVHATNTQCGSGKGTDESTARSGGLGALDFGHCGLDVFVLDGIDEVEGFSGCGTLGLDVPVEVA